jgi:hypothetical protein
MLSKRNCKTVKTILSKRYAKTYKNQKVVFIFERREIFEATVTVAQK